MDDAELDLSLPLVSLSLGLSAVFLFGGPTREDAPAALWLRSGDAIIVTGEARLCYHGVPRIVEGSCPEFLLDPRRYSKFFVSRGATEAGESAGSANEDAGSGVANATAGPLASDESEAFRTALVTYMASARININVRQLARVETAEQLARLIAQRSLHNAEQSAMSSVLGNRSVRQTSAIVASGQAAPVLGTASAASTAGSSRE